MTKVIRKLSDAQLYALDLASRYKLQRSSMGWWAVASDGSALRVCPETSVRITKFSEHEPD